MNQISMSYYYKLRITQGIFFLSILLSSISFLNTKFGIKEFYPFFYWKLYTQPLGNNYLYEDYRLYGVTIKNDTVRIKNKGYANFNQDDYYYFLTGEGQKIMKNEINLNYHKKRLKDFGEFLAPNYSEYILVKESFNPITIVKNPSNYTKEIILSTK